MEVISDELRRCHEEGKVVFFCGAGVSKPAGLPTFRELVKHILNALLPDAGSCNPGSTEALAWRAFKTIDMTKPWVF